MFGGITCNCSIDSAGEFNEFHHDEWRTARKEHQCGECDRIIMPGERYEYVRAKNDGQLWTAKTCLGCTRIRAHWMPDGWYYGSVAEEVEQCIGFNYRTGEGGYDEDEDEEVAEAGEAGAEASEAHPQGQADPEGQAPEGEGG